MALGNSKRCRTNGTGFGFQVLFTLIISPVHFEAGSRCLSRAQADVITLKLLSTGYVRFHYEIRITLYMTRRGEAVGSWRLERCREGGGTSVNLE